MRIINSSFEILDFDDNALEKIEQAARNCYQSEPKGDTEKFVKRLIEREHLTPLEFASITVKIVCDRGVSHELIRHRLASFQQSSTRYCNYSKDKFGNEITVILPSQFANIEHGSQRTAEYFQYQEWKRAMINAENSYMNMLEWGATPEQARSVLPSSLKTEIIMSCNLREWLHIFKLRCSEKSHPDMRAIMIPLLKEVYARCPVVFEDIYLKYCSK